jgi:hypothetical protein
LDSDGKDGLYHWICCELEQKKSLKYNLGEVYQVPFAYALYESLYQEQVVLLTEIEARRQARKGRKRKDETLLTFGPNYIKSTYF